MGTIPPDIKKNVDIGKSAYKIQKCATLRPKIWEKKNETCISHWYNCKNIIFIHYVEGHIVIRPSHWEFSLQKGKQRI